MKVSWIEIDTMVKANITGISPDVFAEYLLEFDPIEIEEIEFEYLQEQLDLIKKK